MSFFGFDTTGPPGDRSAAQFASQDAFGALGGHEEEEEAYNFEETYDGLGDELDEAGDVFNADTFGGSAGDIGKDFDFSGQTADVADAIDDEQVTFSRRQPAQVPLQQISREAQAPLPGSVPDLRPTASVWEAQFPSRPRQAQVPRTIAPSADLWGDAVKPSAGTPAKKFMSLEEVEAQILLGGGAQPSPAPAPGLMLHQQQQQQQLMQHQEPQPQFRGGLPPPGMLPPGMSPHMQHPQMQMGMPPPGQFPPQHQQQGFPMGPPPPGMLPPGMSPMRPPQQMQPPVHQQQQRPPQQPQQIQQQPQDTPQQEPQQPMMGLPPPGGLPQIMAEEQQQRFVEDQKRMRRAQKIATMARHNGLMTASDKAFINRIQIAALVGTSEDPYAEDFYYQVWSTINGGRKGPEEGLGGLAQTYLHQQGQMRRGRRGENPLMRMQNQVQRLVAAAKQKQAQRKNSSSLQGTLGKIVASSVRTPKQLLSVSKSISTDSLGKDAKTAPALSKEGHRNTLRSIENVFDLLLELEERQRKQPNPEDEEAFAEWQGKHDELIQQLWDELRVMDPIDPVAQPVHPFISYVSYTKGKKSIPRVFRLINSEQRMTILTMIVAHLNTLDVVKNAVAVPTSSVREEVDIFMGTVMPQLLGYINEAPLRIVTGLLGILLERVDVVYISRSKVGLAFLTMLTSRAESLRQNPEAPPADAELSQWSLIFNALFARLQGNFSLAFPQAHGLVDDVYVWQWLASIAVGASMEQQHVLVTEVRDKVLDTVIAAKKLPVDVGAGEIAKVNMFLNSMGLDADQLNL
ncbi:DNA topoisomerase 2-associated protein pat1 [Saitoella coloradoensis]